MSRGSWLPAPTPDELFAKLRLTAAAMRAPTIESARKAGHSEAIVWEVQRIDESCQQVHQAVVLEKRMPDVEVVVVTAGFRSRWPARPVPAGS